MRSSRPLATVDVFTAVAYRGNPVAVVLDGAGLDSATMQAFAAWTNLSETTFVLPADDPAADYRLRIFTPAEELPFAGHPTLGSAHAVLEAGLAVPRDGRLVQQCAVGLVEIDCAGPGLTFRLPRQSLAVAPDQAAAFGWLGAGVVAKGAAQAVDVGPVWLVIELAEIAQLAGLDFDGARLAAYHRSRGMTGATLFATGADGEVMVRSLFSPGNGQGIVEDPVCGSGNAAVAAYRLAAGQIGEGSAYVASQGRQLGRDGRVSVRITDGAIHIGGECVTCVTGTVLL